LSFPAILGRDVSGIVRAVGTNVKHFKAGDRVLALSNATYAELCQPLMMMMNRLRNSA